MRAIKTFGVSRRSLLLFAFSKVATPKTFVEDAILDTVTTAVIGPTGNWLLNFRRRTMK